VPVGGEKVRRENNRGRKKLKEKLPNVFFTISDTGDRIG